MGRLADIHGLLSSLLREEPILTMPRDRCDVFACLSLNKGVKHPTLRNSATTELLDHAHHLLTASEPCASWRGLLVIQALISVDSHATRRRPKRRCAGKVPSAM